MTPSYRLLPSAAKDLDDQAGYLMQEASLETALRFYDATASTFEMLAREPGVGERHQSSDLRLDGLRVRRVERFPNHLIFDRPTDAGIDVARVLHGARDIGRMLEEENFGQEQP